MKTIRTLVLDGALPSRLLFVTVWLSLFAYAGRPLLVAAHVEGIAPAIAWGALLGCSLLPLLPALTRRTDTRLKRALLHWTGYAVLGLFSLLLVLVALSDLVRLLFSISVQTMSFSVLAAASGLSLVGLFQARFPCVKRVSIAIEDLPEELNGYRIVQWSDVHVGPTIQRRFVQALVLSHRPQTAKAADRHGVHVQLSGHTHGGQFFPFNLLIRLFQPFVAGLHRVGRTWLYVSRGTGYWGPPSRLGVHGEITVITLARAA